LGRALEEHHAGAVAGAVLDGLRALQHGDLVEGFGEDVGGGRVHAHAAAAEDHLAVEQDAQARGGHAAEHRVAVGAALADHREAGDVLEVVGAVMGGHRLARGAGVGGDGERRVHRRGGHDDLAEGGGLLGEGCRGAGDGGGDGEGRSARWREVRCFMV
jgi:hypothetical protein